MPKMITEIDHETVKNNYLEDNEYLTRSMLKDILTSPRYFYNRYIAKTIEKKRTGQMSFGVMTHVALLEPKKFKEIYLPLSRVAIPSKDAAKVKGRCQWTELTTDLATNKETGEVEEVIIYEEPNTDDARSRMVERLEAYYKRNNIILPSQMQDLKYLIDGLKNNPQVTNNLTGNIQTEMLMLGEIDGIKVKCKADIVNWDTKTILDYKTTDRAIAPKSYAYEINKWGLHIQAFLYREIFRQNGFDFNFKFIVQNKESNEAIVFNPSESLFETGKQKTKLALGIYRNCREFDNWTDYVDAHGNTNYTSEFDLDPTGAME